MASNTLVPPFPHITAEDVYSAPISVLLMNLDLADKSTPLDAFHNVLVAAKELLRGRPFSPVLASSVAAARAYIALLPPNPRRMGYREIVDRVGAIYDDLIANPAAAKLRMEREFRPFFVEMMLVYSRHMENIAIARTISLMHQLTRCGDVARVDSQLEITASRRSEYNALCDELVGFVNKHGKRIPYASDTPAKKPRLTVVASNLPPVAVKKE